MRGKAYNKENIIELLSPFLKLGMSVVDACKCVGIPQSTVATWSAQNEEVRFKIHSLQCIPTTEALRNIVKAIKVGDLSTSKWWLERKEKPEFSLRPISGTDAVPRDIKLIIGKPPNDSHKNND